MFDDSKVKFDLLIGLGLSFLGAFSYSYGKVAKTHE